MTVCVLLENNHVNLNFLVTMLSVLIIGIKSNLFCNADFSTYQTPMFFDGSPFYNVKYNLLPADSCWYPSIWGYMIEVQRPSFYNNVSMAELRSTNPYTLCQKLSLDITVNYTWSFNIYLNPYTKTSTVTVAINQIKQTTCYQDSSIYPNPKKCQGFFKPTVTTNRFCVNASDTYDSEAPSSLYFDDFATSVSNFNIQPVTNSTNSTTTSIITNATNSTNNVINNTTSNTTINTTNNTANDTTSNSSNNSASNTTSNTANSSTQNTNSSDTSNGTEPPKVDDFNRQYTIVFQVTNDESNNALKLVSITKQLNSAINYYFQFITFYLDGQPQKFINQYNSQGYFILLIPIYRAYNLQTLSYSFASSQMPPLYPKIKIQFLWKQVMVYTTSDSQKKMVEIARKTSSIVIKSIFGAARVLQTATCSYFLINFINFFSLILLYNFLNINTQPQFSYQTLKRLTQLIFDNRNSFLGMIQSIAAKLNLNGKKLQSSSFLSTTPEKQRVPSILNRFQWFNSFGVTYDFLQNNINLLLNFAKFLLFFVILKVLRWLTHKKIIKNRQFTIIIFVQILCGSATINISALQTIRSSGHSNIKQLLNEVFQIIMLGGIISSLYLFLIFVFYNKPKATKNKKLIQIKKDQKFFELKLYYKNCFQFLQHSLYIMISCLIVIRSQIIFFVIISILIAIMFFNYYRGFFYFTIYKRIYIALLLIDLLVHHTCFCFLFLFSKLSIENQFKYSTECKMSGIIVIWTILIGFFIEVFDTLVQTLYFIFQSIKGIGNKCKFMNKEKFCKKNQKCNLKTLKNIQSKQNKGYKINIIDKRGKKQKVKMKNIQQSSIFNSIFVPVTKCRQQKVQNMQQEERSVKKAKKFKNDSKLGFKKMKKQKISKQIILKNQASFDIYQ